MSEQKDALDYMNELCQWDDPPPSDERWEKKIAHACDQMVGRDERITELTGHLFDQCMISDELERERGEYTIDLTEANSKRLTAERERDEARQQLRQREEDEGGCCPENVSFVDHIKWLEQARGRLQALVGESQTLADAAITDRDRIREKYLLCELAVSRLSEQLTAANKTIEDHIRLIHSDGDSDIDPSKHRELLDAIAEAFDKYRDDAAESARLLATAIGQLPAERFRERLIAASLQGQRAGCLEERNPGYTDGRLIVWRSKRVAEMAIEDADAVIQAAARTAKGESDD